MILDITVPAQLFIEFVLARNLSANLPCIKQYEIVSIRLSGLTMCGRYVQETDLVAGRHYRADMYNLDG